jgi:dolichyl-phosphate-mannose-protein mannosyltransferase
MIYMSCFYVHFSILDHSGPGDATMSSLFQAGLVGNPISKSPLEVAYGSVITLRNRGIAGGLLHSHIQGYPDGSKQQQVTGYSHRDENNDWKVAFQHGDLSANSTFTDEIRFLSDGDLLRLIHIPTKRNLHSHLVPAHVSKGDFEVSCYGNDTMFADPNDHWTIEVVDNRVNYGDSKKIHSLSTNFRLKHVVVGCYLSSTKAVLPDWGFKQAEVTCEKSASPGKNTLWNVESHVNELRKTSGEHYIYSDLLTFSFKYLLETRPFTSQALFRILSIAI